MMRAKMSAIEILSSNRDLQLPRKSWFQLNTVFLEGKLQCRVL